MKTAFSALANSKHKSNPLANEFFRWVPKRMFGREEVWMATSEYLDLLADRYTTAPVDEARKDLLWVLEQDPDDHTRSYVDQYLQMLDQQQKSKV